MTVQSQNTIRILLAEDEESIYRLLLPYFELEGYDLEWVADGKEALARALAEDFDLFLLDVQLPGLGGVELCRKIRAARPTRAIIMLTSLGSEIDKVVALDAGADDYVTKPFGMHELTARVRARLRATTSTAANQASLSEIRFGDVTIDPLKRTISKGTKKVEVTTLEFNLLLLLASNPGKPVSREELLQRIWQVDNKSYQANVSQVIRRIRKKIEDDPDNPQILLTVRGFGYAFCEQP